MLTYTILFCLYNSLFIGVFGSGVYLSIYVVQAQHIVIYLTLSISKATYLNMCLRNRTLRKWGEGRICIQPTPDCEFRFCFILRNHLT